MALLLFARWITPWSAPYHGTRPAVGIFGVVGTGFAVLLAFVIFSVFGSYSAARATVGVESLSVRQLYQAAGYFPPAPRAALRGELICYARAVVVDEWPIMGQQRESDAVNTWASRLQGTAQGLDLPSAREQAAFRTWLDESNQRQEGRRGRLTEAVPSVPPYVWVSLLLITALVLAFAASFLDPREGRVPLALQLGALAGTVVLSLALIWVLDRPFAGYGVGIAPTRLAAALASMQAEQRALTPSAVLPCDSSGRTTASRS